jgi:hypothetical protein
MREQDVIKRCLTWVTPTDSSSWWVVSTNLAFHLIVSHPSKINVTYPSLNGEQHPHPGHFLKPMVRGQPQKEHAGSRVVPPKPSLVLNRAWDEFISLCPPPSVRDDGCYWDTCRWQQLPTTPCPHCLNSVNGCLLLKTSCEQKNTLYPGGSILGLWRQGRSVYPSSRELGAYWAFSRYEATICLLLWMKWHSWVRWHLTFLGMLI